MSKNSTLKRPIERYHTADEFNRSGLRPFQEHIAAYFAGERSIPVSRTFLSLFGARNDLFFTFSDELLRRFLEKPGKMTKPYEVALKYGFRGYSKGGTNGIFYQRDGDRRLQKRTTTLTNDLEEIVIQHLQITNPNHLSDLKNVKIVHHNPSGERIVGVYNPQLSRILFLGFAHY